jgi:hypothetical protein
MAEPQVLLEGIAFGEPHPACSYMADMRGRPARLNVNRYRSESAFSMELSRLWRLRSVNWADMTGPLPTRRPTTYNLLYVNGLAVEEDSQ